MSLISPFLVDARLDNLTSLNLHAGFISCKCRFERTITMQCPSPNICFLSILTLIESHLCVDECKRQEKALDMPGVLKHDMVAECILWRILLS